MVNADLHLRQGPAGRAEDHLAVLRHVERGLVAGAQQVVRLLLVEAHGATHVGADLRVGHDPIVTPVALLGHRDVVRVEAHEQDRGLALLLEDMLALVDALGHDVEDGAARDILGLVRVASGSRMSFMPLRQNVVDRASPGSGPRPPATWSTRGTANRPSAPPRVYLISGRRPSWAWSPPPRIVSTAPARSSSWERSVWRSSTTSSSGMSVLAQWTAPAPIMKRLINRLTPRTTFCRLARPMPGMKTLVSWSMAK